MMVLEPQSSTKTTRWKQRTQVCERVITMMVLEPQSSTKTTRWKQRTQVCERVITMTVLEPQSLTTATRWKQRMRARNSKDSSAVTVISENNPMVTKDAGLCMIQGVLWGPQSPVPTTIWKQGTQVCERGIIMVVLEPQSSGLYTRWKQRTQVCGRVITVIVLDHNLQGHPPDGNKGLKSVNEALL